VETYGKNGTFFLYALYTLVHTQGGIIILPNYISDYFSTLIIDKLLISTVTAA